MSPQPPSILRLSPMVSAHPSFKDKPAHDLPVQTGSSQAHFQLFARQSYIIINSLQTYFPRALGPFSELLSGSCRLKTDPCGSLLTTEALGDI